MRLLKLHFSSILLLVAAILVIEFVRPNGGFFVSAAGPVGGIDIASASLEVTGSANAAAVYPGQTIDYTYQITNTGTVTLTVIAVNDRLDSVLFLNPTLAAGETTWGTMSRAVDQNAAPGPLTNTVTVTGWPPEGEPVATIVTTTVTITNWRQVYLPLILNPGSDNPTVPGNAREITATIAGALHSQAESYNEAITGGYVGGTDILYNALPEHYWALNFSLIQCKYQTIEYHLNRAYFEFDTSGVSNFSRAYLEFRNDTAYPGPPAHSVNIHQGTWTQLLTNTYVVQPENWTAYGALVATVPGHTAQLPVTATVTVPAAYINRGGMTKFVFKTSTEGSPPAPYSCMGGANGLGGSVGLPYLYIVP